MREILFRGKCADTGKWYQGQYIHLHKTAYCFKEDYDKDKNNDIYQIVFEKMTDWGLPNQHLRVDVIPETVGQYTGLTDKNGKKIFEGDILKSVICWCDTPKNGVVTFKDGAFGFIWHRGKTEMFHAFTSVCNIEYEVIGNIHDNPELLGGVNNEAKANYKSL